jgi:hypothetical protein
MAERPSILRGLANQAALACEVLLSACLASKPAPMIPLISLPYRVCEEWFLSIGCAIGYWQGDVGKLASSCLLLRVHA